MKKLLIALTALAIATPTLAHARAIDHTTVLNCLTANRDLISVMFHIDPKNDLRYDQMTFIFDKFKGDSTKIRLPIKNVEFSVWQGKDSDHATNYIKFDHQGKRYQIEHSFSQNSPNVADRTRVLISAGDNHQDYFCEDWSQLQFNHLNRLGDYLPSK